MNKTGTNHVTPKLTMCTVRQPEAICFLKVKLDKGRAKYDLRRPKYYFTINTKNLKSFIIVKAHCSMTHLKQQKSLGFF